MAKTGFMDTLFNHVTWRPTGQSRRALDDDNVYVHLDEHEPLEHWGLKENCRRCRREGTMGRFENRLSTKGMVVVSLVIAITIVIFILAVL
jgi:hypothetical protein